MKHGRAAEIHDFTAMGPVLADRPYAHTEHSWQVYFATNAALADTFGTAGYPAPGTIHRVHQG
jgi:small conductance mechanosensitive channel